MILIALYWNIVRIKEDISPKTGLKFGFLCKIYSECTYIWYQILCGISNDIEWAYMYPGTHKMSRSNLKYFYLIWACTDRYIFLTLCLPVFQSYLGRAISSIFSMFPWNIICGVLPPPSIFCISIFGFWANSHLMRFW